MSVLLCTIAAGFVSYGLVPERAAMALAGQTNSEYTTLALASPTLPDHSTAALLEQQDSEKIDRFMETAIDRLHIPGAAIGIVSKDGEIYTKGYGKTNANGKAVTPQTPFILGSTSKSFTGLAVMQLADEGKIDLDAPVQTYLPEFTAANAQGAAAVTVRQLLNQTSGIPAIAGLKLHSSDLSLKQYPATLKDMKLRGADSAKFEYSNTNYNVLGALIQAVSGQTYGEYVQKHIFTPLSMEHSFTSRALAEQNGLSQGHQSVFGWVRTANPPERPVDVPSGYIMSSAEDMAHYLIAQMNNGVYNEKRVVSEASALLMHGQDGAPMGKGATYGMGWIAVGHIITHDGGVENFSSNMLIEGDTGIVLLLNKNGSSVGVITEGIRNILKGEEPPSIPSESGSDWLVRVISLLVFLFVLRSIYVTVRWRRDVRPERRSIIVHSLSIGILHLALPLFLLFAAPNLLQVTWEIALAFMPGISHLLLIASIMLLAFGISRLILLISSLRNPSSLTTRPQ
ncbi:serine hydrolase domain-containing protein [Paenibacillus sp. NPDC058174]|uniref:serine hydrolase domain-containing protein n=1 Tax=Paenibacillus sp. NPDC058174 TaxID=3346366 RepID=UPI0036D9D68C